MIKHLSSTESTEAETEETDVCVEILQVELWIFHAVASFEIFAIHKY